METQAAEQSLRYRIAAQRIKGLIGDVGLLVACIVRTVVVLGRRSAIERLGDG